MVDKKDVVEAALKQVPCRSVRSFVCTCDRSSACLTCVVSARLEFLRTIGSNWSIYHALLDDACVQLFASVRVRAQVQECGIVFIDEIDKVRSPPPVLISLSPRFRGALSVRCVGLRTVGVYSASQLARPSADNFTSSTTLKGEGAWARQCVC